MIRHIVFVRIRPEVQRHEVEGLFAELAALKDVVPGLLSFASGPDSSPEGLARGYTHAFSVDFVDAAARDAYLPHPAHQKAGARLVAATQGGLDGLAVLDFEVS